MFTKITFYSLDGVDPGAPVLATRFGENAVSPTYLKTINESSYASTDVFYIKNVRGLDPVKADLQLTSYSNQDSDVYTGSRVGKRNIVVTFGVSPWKSPEQVTQALQRFFTPKTRYQLVFGKRAIDGIDYGIDAYVEDVQRNVFSNNLDIQISFICPSPYFSADGYKTVTFNTDETFFPPNLGSAPSGFSLFFTTTKVPLKGFTIMFNNNRLNMEFVGDLKLPGNGYLVNDSVELSTVKGEKRLQVNHLNRLGGIVSGNLNMALDRTNNSIQVSRKFANVVWPMPPKEKVTLQYNPKYSGI